MTVQHPNPLTLRVVFTTSHRSLPLFGTSPPFVVALLIPPVSVPKVTGVSLPGHVRPPARSPRLFSLVTTVHPVEPPTSRTPRCSLYSCAPRRSAHSGAWFVLTSSLRSVPYLVHGLVSWFSLECPFGTPDSVPCVFLFPSLGVSCALCRCRNPWSGYRLSPPPLCVPCPSLCSRWNPLGCRSRCFESSSASFSRVLILSFS